MVNRDEIREQFIDAFEDAEYPVAGPMDLLPALPNGPGTTFESGEFSMTAIELNGKSGDGNFPYDSVEELTDDIMDGLESKGYL